MLDLRCLTAPCSLLIASLVLPAALSSSPASLDPVQEPDLPTDREIEALVEEYFGIGPRAVGEGRARQLEILEVLELVPPLDARAEEKWREDLLELWMEGPKLDKKGRNHLWEDTDEGLYIIGGKTRKAQGLLLGMHGGGVGEGDAGNSAGAWSGPATKLKWAAVFPEVLEKTEHGWTTSGTEEFVLELIDRAVRTFEVDPNRVFLAGHSMGGYGTWTLGAHHADRVAGLAASAGAPTPLVDPRSKEVVGIDWGVIPNLRNVPMVVYQSTDDPQVPPDSNQAAAREVAKARERWGGYEEFRYWEVSGQGHDAPPGGYLELLQQVEEYVRDPRPAQVVWQPVLDWKRQFYWLHWERPQVGPIVVAELDREENEVRITTDRPVTLKDFTVFLDREMLDLSVEVKVSVNGEVVRRRKPPEPNLATLVRTGVTGDPGRTYAVAVTW